MPADSVTRGRIQLADDARLALLNAEVAALLARTLRRALTQVGSDHHQQIAAELVKHLLLAEAQLVTRAFVRELRRTDAPGHDAPLPIVTVGGAH